MPSRSNVKRRRHSMDLDRGRACGRSFTSSVSLSVSETRPSVVRSAPTSPNDQMTEVSRADNDRQSDHMIAFQITTGYACGMDLGAPVLDVAPGVRGALLQALARLEQPVTRRQLASLAGVSPGNAS